MKKWINLVLFAGLAGYSLLLLAGDIRFGQDAVRGYFSDITVRGDFEVIYAPLYGINTTLTVLLLSGAGLFFVLSALSAEGGDARDRFYRWAQAGLFFYLAADERLMLHEKMANLLGGFNDAFLLAAIGVAQLVLLVLAGKVFRMPRRIAVYLILAGAFFAIMIGIDAVFPEKMPGRLALEDLSKLWAIVFLFIYGFRFYMQGVLDSGAERQ